MWCIPGVESPGWSYLTTRCMSYATQMHMVVSRMSDVAKGHLHLRWTYMHIRCIQSYNISLLVVNACRVLRVGRELDADFFVRQIVKCKIKCNQIIYDKHFIAFDYMWFCIWLHVILHFTKFICIWLCILCLWMKSDAIECSQMLHTLCDCI